MARPRKDAHEKPAKQRLEDVFWEMLAEGPFSGMTIKAISARAGVNHNTFYYHFGSLEDMAEKLFEKNMLRSMIVAIAQRLRSADPVSEVMELNAEELDRLHKVQLFARSDSPFLTGLLNDSIRSVWLEILGVDEKTLSADELVDIDFAVGGEMALMRQEDSPLDGKTLARFAARPLGQGVFAMLSELEERRNGQQTDAC